MHTLQVLLYYHYKMKHITFDSFARWTGITHHHLPLLFTAIVLENEEKARTHRVLRLTRKVRILMSSGKVQGSWRRMDANHWCWPLLMSHPPVNGCQCALNADSWGSADTWNIYLSIAKEALLLLLLLNTGLLGMSPPGCSDTQEDVVKVGDKIPGSTE